MSRRRLEAALCAGQEIDKGIYMFIIIIHNDLGIKMLNNLYFIVCVCAKN